MGDYVNGLTEVQTDDFSGSSSWCSYTKVGGHYVDQSGFAYGIVKRVTIRPSAPKSSSLLRCSFYTTIVADIDVS